MQSKVDTLDGLGLRRWDSLKIGYGREAASVVRMHSQTGTRIVETVSFAGERTADGHRRRADVLELDACFARGWIDKLRSRRRGRTDAYLSLSFLTAIAHRVPRSFPRDLQNTWPEAQGAQ